MRGQGVKENVKCSATIKVNGISLTTQADYMGKKIKRNYQIGDDRFRFSGTILSRIRFKLQEM
jgi:hypothetical protein